MKITRDRLNIGVVRPHCPGISVAQITDVTSRYSHLSFALASSIVCHCMLDGLSAPPCLSGIIWSTT